MQTKEEFFKSEEEEYERELKKMKEKHKKELQEELIGLTLPEVKEMYINTRLAQTSFYIPNVSSMTWKYLHDECRFCGLEYIGGEHEHCCDNCWEENKNKTLEELEYKMKSGFNKDKFKKAFG